MRKLDINGDQDLLAYCIERKIFNHLNSRSEPVSGMLLTMLTFTLKIHIRENAPLHLVPQSTSKNRLIFLPKSLLYCATAS